MGKYVLPPLPYRPDALEPYLDATTIEIHHRKHHQAYTDSLNNELTKINALSHRNYIVGILLDLESVPKPSREAINFFGGGYENHRMFWESMRPNGGGSPGGRLADEIEVYFGGFESLKKSFTEGTVAIQGSGWGWLVYNQTYSRLEFMTTPNETSPWVMRKIPLLGLDIWEHAYYTRYQNERSTYVNAWWNVVDWSRVEDRFTRVAQ